MLVGVGVDAIGVIEDAVIVHVVGQLGGELEALGGAGGGYHGVGGCHGRNNVLNDALSEAIRDTGDA